MVLEIAESIRLRKLNLKANIGIIIGLIVDRPGR
jgi:hypothetical protein